MGVREYPDTPRVFLDFDGPLADFELAVEQENSSFANHKHLIGAYSRLPITPGAQEAVAKIIQLQFEPWGLTKIPKGNPHAASEKLIWAQEHFPALHDRITITPDKGDAGRYCDILIDDHPEWANANNFRGITLKFTPSDGWAPIIKQLEACATALKEGQEHIVHFKKKHSDEQAQKFIGALFQRAIDQSA
jgi:hypothetical protein